MAVRYNVVSVNSNLLCSPVHFVSLFKILSPILQILMKSVLIGEISKMPVWIMRTFEAPSQFVFTVSTLRHCLLGV